MGGKLKFYSSLPTVNANCIFICLLTNRSEYVMMDKMNSFDHKREQPASENHKLERKTMNDNNSLGSHLQLLKSLMKAQLEMFRIYKNYTSLNLATKETQKLNLPSVNDYEIISDLEIAKIMVDRAKEILTIESGLE